jgi:ATP-binding cassette, subfamily B, bacterial PglK
MAKFEGGGRALQTLYHTLSRGRKRQAWLTAVLMLVGAIAEVLSVGAILPFLSIVANPGKAASIPGIGMLFEQLAPAYDPITTTAVAFVFFAIISAALRLLLTWVSQSFAFHASYDLSNQAFHRAITQPYRFYISGNSSEIVAGFEKIYGITYSVLVAGVQALVSSVIALMLIIFLLSLNPRVALSAAGILVGAYILLSVGVRNVLAANSQTIAACSTERVKRVQEALGGIRDILIDSSQTVFEADFQASARKLSRAQTLNAYINIAPKIVIEALGMVLIAGLAWYMAHEPGGVSAAIPLLGALALGAQRLLPLLQMSYVGWSQFLGSSQMLIDVARILQLPEPSPCSPSTTGELDFSNAITFKDVSFGYLPGQSVLRHISLAIAKGERLGIVGKTGSGKSTLTDLLLGLLEPGQGSILIDGTPLTPDLMGAWQKQVAHVPQAIYLADDTVAANIAFGQKPSSVDMDRVREAARSAGIAAFIESLPDGYLSSCGERGVRFSGGQRQRIGIARALYKKASVLVMDEATSALDAETETAVIEAISRLASDITVILVAHRLSTLSGCDRIIRLKDGMIEAIAPSVAELG